jgi:hypothetical protein
LRAPADYQGKQGEFDVEPERQVDHSSKAPLKSDIKPGVQPNQQPGVKIPKKDGEKEEKNKGEGSLGTGEGES